MRRIVMDVATGTGTTGTVNASSSQVAGQNGKLYALYLDYGSVTSITNVTLALTTPLLTLVTISDNATDGWYFPRELPVNESAAGYTSGHAVAQAFPIVGDLRLSVSSSTPSVTAVTAYVFIEEQ